MAISNRIPHIELVIEESHTKKTRNFANYEIHNMFDEQKDTSYDHVGQLGSHMLQVFPGSLNL